MDDSADDTDSLPIRLEFGRALNGELRAVNFETGKLNGKVAIVTGASQGIGCAVALGLARAGADLILAKHPSGRHEEIRRVEVEILALGRRAVAIITDVSNVSDVQAMVQKADELFGRIDILVNNAGWTGNSLALDVTEEEYDKTMAATLKSVFFACQAAAPVMIREGGGKIVNIGSNFGEVGFKTRSVYAAAKAGVHHLSRAAYRAAVEALKADGTIPRRVALRQCQYLNNLNNVIEQDHRTVKKRVWLAKGLWFVSECVAEAAGNRNSEHDPEEPSEMAGKRGCGRPSSLHRQAVRSLLLTQTHT